MTHRYPIPETTIARLPVYLRSLTRLADAEESVVSSERLAQLTGMHPAKVRKDMAYVGASGTRGVGYDVAHLVATTTRELQRSCPTPVVIVGAGQLGRALAGYGGFAVEGFRIAALFDVDRAKVGQRVGGVAVRHLDELGTVVSGLEWVIGLLTTPPEAAQPAADAMVAAGVGAVLNFSPTTIGVPERVWLRNVDVAVELQILAHRRLAAEVSATRGVLA